MEDAMADPTFNVQSLEQLITKIATDLLDAKAKQSRPTAKGSDIDRLVAKAFKRAGFGDVEPRVNVKTFNKWIEAGRRPMEGEKSIKVKQFRLFAKSQTRPLTTEEKAGLAAKRTADRLPVVSPVETKAEAKPQTKAKAPATKAPATITPLKPKGKGPHQPTA
jgi:hypothetical protein